VIVCEATQTITVFITTLIVEAPGFCYAGFMSDSRCRTILYGNSLILEGVRAELSSEPGIEVVIFDQSLNDPLEEIRALKPAVIIFDLGVVQTSFPLAMLEQPNLLLIGIDPETHQAQVWSGRQRRAVVAADLISIIHQKDV
jgi:hypothetical protein